MTAAVTLASDPAPYRILDPHVHVWKHQAQFPFAPGAKVPDYDATPEMLLGLMKANGVAKTVIIQVIHVAMTTVISRRCSSSIRSSFKGCAGWILWIRRRRII